MNLNRMHKRHIAPPQIAGWYRLARDPGGMVGLVIILAYLVMAFLGESITPYDPIEQNFMITLQAPSAAHPFGTDALGRDVLSRVVVGARDVMLLAFASTSLALILGTTVGLITGYYGGAVDHVLMRSMDVLLAFPPLLLALLVISLLGTDRLNVILAIGVLFMPQIARIVRSRVQALRSLPFIDAARLRGEGVSFILLREILPNVMSVLTVEFSIRFTYAILMAASLGFLGLGVQPPAPDWGLQVNEGRDYLLIAPWIVIYPSLAIGGLILGVMLLSDSLSRTLFDGSTSDV